MQPKLLIGMAVFDDFDGVYFTIQSLRLHHAEVMRDVEFAVVDNNPNFPHGKAVKEFLNWVKGDVAAVHYVPFTEAAGTAVTRQHLFTLGTAPAVLCLDPHVLLAPGSVQRLLDWYDAHPDTRNLHQGPMIYDDLKNYSTHFEDVWGDDQMWGRWGTDPRGANADAPPFEIPAMGLGLFSCRRDAWLGFNPRFRGFGGEEWYIHEKFRQAGHQTLCLPFLRWVHRFGRPAGVRYPLQLWDKARNYVIGLSELGIPLDRAKQAFVGSGKISEKNWQALLDGKDQPIETEGCGCSNKPQPTDNRSLEELFQWVKQTPRDLDQHAVAIRELASEAKTITAFCKRREWNIILAAARPERLVVYQAEHDPLLRTVHDVVRLDNQARQERKEPITTYITHEGDRDASLRETIEPCDLLILDTVHSAERLTAELERHAARAHRILVRSTGAFGEQAEGSNQPGLLPALRKWVHEHPDWTVIQHVKHQWGYSVLSCDPNDKKPLPPLWKQAVNAAKASWRASKNVLQNYGPLKDSTTQEERLALCLICPEHSDGRCSSCGCPIDKKTSWPTEFCPLGHWHAEKEGKESTSNPHPPSKVES